MEDDALEGVLQMLSAYTSTSDSGLFAAALLGLFGVVLEGLACFGVYRLMAAKSPKYAHRYRSGIFGYLMFCACGFHVPVCAAVFLMKHGLSEALLTQYSAYFLMPPLVLFWIFFFVLVMTQTVAFRKGLTPYLKWCCVFSMTFGMLVYFLAALLGNQPLGNALRCAGFYHALRTGAQGKTCVLAEISGAEGVQPVMADTAAGEASTVMPLPRAVQPADWPDVQAVRVTFDGITHFVMDRAQPDDALVQRAIAAAPEASAVGALFLDRAAGSMQPVVFVRETGSCVAETSCASGSVATAVVLTADFADGITEIGIGQPGGTLEVGVQRAHGAVTGLSIGGPVRLAQTLTVALADAPC